ncbi:MAG: AraC family transcriptional regulator [Candidatus Marinimicrobia bacterium]|nr:AraC family transcriptional regulator [Candidatus Neomarinimicrobiota bacterium]
MGGLTLAGQLSQRTGMRAPRDFDQYALVYVLEGAGRYRDGNGTDQRLSAGDLILVFPHVPHQYGPEPGETWTEFFLCFQGPVFDLWRQTGVLDPSRPLFHLKPVDSWLRRFEQLARPAEPADPESALRPLCRLQHLLADILLAARESPGHRANQDWLGRVGLLLDAQPEAPLDLAAVARSLRVSPEALRKRFTRLTGQTPAQYRTARLMERACTLLQQDQRTSKEIADALGFCDEYYFSRRFKQIVGQTPTAFRRRFLST